jgi:hypothetical protein
MNFFRTHPINAKKHKIPGSLKVLFEQNRVHDVID